MKRCMNIRNAFLTITIALLLLTVCIAPVLAEEAKPAAAVSAQAAAAPTPAASEEEKPTADFNVAALTKYVWRGYEQTRDSIVVQPSFTVGYKGLRASGAISTPGLTRRHPGSVIPALGRKPISRYPTVRPSAP